MSSSGQWTLKMLIYDVTYYYNVTTLLGEVGRIFSGFFSSLERILIGAHSEKIVIFREELLQNIFPHLPSVEKKVSKDFTESFFSRFL